MAANLLKMSCHLIKFVDTGRDSSILFWLFIRYSILSSTA